MTEFGCCECGCGGKTNIAKGTDSRRGWVKGKPLRFIFGHQGRKSGVEYIVDHITGCWVWQLYVAKHGYGRSRKNYAHVVMYEKHKGAVPEGYELDHKCSNRSCVNPEHLEPVPHVVNSQRGSQTKYTVDIVKKIRQLKLDGLGSRVVSRLMGIPRSTVGFIMSRRRWKNV